MLGVSLSFASPKESKQRKGDPGSVPAARVPCATRNAGRLRNSGLCPSNSARRRPPALLRCSAPLKGPGKASRRNRQSSFWVSLLVWLPKFAFSWAEPSVHDASRVPMRGAEQRRLKRRKGEDCLRAQPEFRSPRSNRVAQGTGAAGTDPGSPFLCLLSFGEAKESETPSKGGTHPPNDEIPNYEGQPQPRKGLESITP